MVWVGGGFLPKNRLDQPKNVEYSISENPPGRRPPQVTERALHAPLQVAQSRITNVFPSYGQLASDSIYLVSHLTRRLDPSTHFSSNPVY